MTFILWTLIEYGLEVDYPSSEKLLKASHSNGSLRLYLLLGKECFLLLVIIYIMDFRSLHAPSYEQVSWDSFSIEMLENAVKFKTYFCLHLIFCLNWLLME